MRLLLVLLLACWIFAPAPLRADAPSVIFVLDGSGSMNAKVEGRPKIQIAREVMGDMVQKMPTDTRVGLVAYGHNRKDDCADIEVLAPVGTQRTTVVDAMSNMIPKGKTPLAAAVKQAAGELREHEGNASIIVISDGEETCAGDPCAAARDATGGGVNLRVHVVGFDVTPEEREQLVCVAEKGNGKYFAANDAAGLVVALAEVQRELAATPQPKPTEQPTPKPSPRAAFRDDFEGKELSESYTVLKRDDNRLTLVDGNLMIVPTLPPKGTRTPINLVLLEQTFNGGFVATIRLSAQTELSSVAGLYYWIDENNYLFLGPWGRRDGSGNVSFQYFQNHLKSVRWPTFAKVLGGKWDVKSQATRKLGDRNLIGMVAASEAWHLELKREGVKYTGRVSADGVNWEELGTHVILNSAGRIGIGAHLEDTRYAHENPVEIDEFIVNAGE